MSAPQKTESGQTQNAPETKTTGSGAPPATAPAPAAKQVPELAKGSKWKALAGNGAVKRPSRSLAVPGDDGGSERSGSVGSERRESKLSLGSQISGIDLSKIQAQQVQQAGGDLDTDKSKNNQVSNDSYLRSSIPYLPQWVAVICLIMNIIIPGSGTILSGFSIFCCGKPRVVTKGDQVMETFCVNVWVGIIQLCTVTFMLVGWFWSFVWGIYMIILAAELKKEEKQKKEKQLQAMALTAFNADVRPWSLGN